jgi:hypothetical protein
MGRRQRRRDRQTRQRVLPTTTVATPPPSTQTAKPPSPPELDRLRHLVDQARRLREDLDGELDRLAAAGVGWPAIAAVLGVSRQAVRQRHARRHGRGDGRRDRGAARLAS